MLKQLILASAIALAAFGGSKSAWSGQYGTDTEAIAMLKRAAAELRDDASVAIMEFNHNKRQFRDRDLFVFCFNAYNGAVTAHEAMVGHDIKALRDSAGKPFGEEMFRNAAEDKIVEVDFLSPVPGSTNVASKRAYVIRIGGYVCGVSAYKLDEGGQPVQ